MSEFARGGDTNKIVYFDMDGVLYDFDKQAVASIPERDRPPRKHFYVNDDYADRPEYQKRIEASYNQPDFFEQLEVAPGALDSIEALLQEGYTPRILSTPLHTNPRSIEGKRASLQRDFVPYFGQSFVDDAIFHNKKWQYEGLVLFEDRPELATDPQRPDFKPWEHVYVTWKYDELNIPMSKAAFWLSNFRNPELVVEIVKEIESTRK